MPKNMENIFLRVKAVREKLGINQEDFGKLLGVSRATIGNFETNFSKPKIAELIKIAEIGNVTLDWLLKGEESTFTPPITNLKELKGSEARPANATLYPLVDKVTAGDFSANVHQDNIVEYYPVNYVRKNCFLVEVEGDSMTSEDPDLSISPGDLLLIDPIETVTPGDLVVAKLTSTRHMIKQFFISKDGIELKSYNPNHPSIFITPDQLEYIFRVVYHQPKGRRK